MTPPPAVFCALDRPDLAGALALGRALLGVVGGLKVGLEFVTANGPDGVRRVVDLGLPVFLDVKFHDIPNTVAGAVRAAGALGVAMLNLHIAGGPAMLRAAVEAAASLEPRPCAARRDRADQRRRSRPGGARRRRIGSRSSAPPGGARPGVRAGWRDLLAARDRRAAPAAAAPASSSWCRASAPGAARSTIRSG